MELAYELGRCTGPKITDCHFLGARWVAKDSEEDPDDVRQEAIVCRREGTRSTVVMRWAGPMVDMFRLPEGRLYVTNSSGWLWRNDQPVQGGPPFEREPVGFVHRVWGLNESCVFAWTFKKVYFFDGNSWSEIDPPFRVSAMHGVSPDLIYAVGHGIARWNGSGFTEMATGTRRPFYAIHVVSDDEMYAISNREAIWEGSVHGWSQRTDPTQQLTSIAKWNDKVWVGHTSRGLCTLQADDSLEAVKPNLPATHLEARDELLISTRHAVVGTADGALFKGVAANALGEMTQNLTPRWE